MKEKTLKHALKEFIAMAEPQRTFDFLKQKGCDISDIEARYQKREERDNYMVRHALQYSQEEYEQQTSEFDSDNKALLRLIDANF